MKCIICKKQLYEGKSGCKDSPTPHIHWNLRFIEITTCGSHTQGEVEDWVKNIFESIKNPKSR